MRIAVDARELTGQPTGVGRYLKALLDAWGEMPEAASHEFLLCSPDPITLRAGQHLRATHVTAPGAGTLWEQRVLPRLVRSAGADVLFAPAYTCPLRCPAPVVLMIHDVSFTAHPEWFSWREGLRRRVVTWLSARRAARVITQSGFSKREISRHLGIGAARIDVIPLGVSPLHETGGCRTPLVLYVGSLFNRRHVPELIEVFRRLDARVPDARLEIVGDNRTSPHIDVDALVAATGLASRISVRSYVSDAELGALYGRASAFAFLSEYEGFGLTPLEAMAAGIPIVVLDTEIAREVYGPAAVYVERPDPDLVANALERVLTNDGERMALIDAGHRQVQRYSWHECARQTLQVLVAAA